MTYWPLSLSRFSLCRNLALSSNAVCRDERSPLLRVPYGLPYGWSDVVEYSVHTSESWLPPLPLSTDTKGEECPSERSWLPVTSSEPPNLAYISFSSSSTRLGALHACVLPLVLDPSTLMEEKMLQTELFLKSLPQSVDQNTLSDDDCRSKLLCPSQVSGAGQGTWFVGVLCPSLSEACHGSVLLGSGKSFTSLTGVREDRVSRLTSSNPLSLWMDSDSGLQMPSMA